MQMWYFAHLIVVDWLGWMTCWVRKMKTEKWECYCESCWLTNWMCFLGVNLGGDNWRSLSSGGVRNSDSTALGDQKDLSSWRPKTTRANSSVSGELIYVWRLKGRISIIYLSQNPYHFRFRRRKTTDNLCFIGSTIPSCLLCLRIPWKCSILSTVWSQRSWNFLMSIFIGANCSLIGRLTLFIKKKHFQTELRFLSARLLVLRS